MLSLKHDVEISVVLRDAKDFCIVFQSVLGDDSSYNISSIPEVNIRGTHFLNPLPKHTSLLDMAISVLRIVDKEGYESDKKTLLEMLDTITIPKIERNRRDTDGNVIVRNREAIIGTEGRTCNFGLIRGRKCGYAVSKYSIKHPRIYRAIFDFAKHVCPPGMDVTSVTLNYGVKAKKHKDSFNVGDSVIVGISNYQGGKLRVYTSETEYNAYDIKDTPLMFNGSELAHETEDFTGKRYTIIYYSQRPKHREWTVEFPVVGTAQCLEPGNRTVPG